MRSCGRCGLPGHNKRTCPALTGEPVKQDASPAPATSRTKVRSCLSCARLLPKGDDEDECLKCRTSAPKRLVIQDLDAETLEAIKWYMEKAHPDWYPSKKTKIAEDES